MSLVIWLVLLLMVALLLPEGLGGHVEASSLSYLLFRSSGLAKWLASLASGSCLITCIAGWFVSAWTTNCFLYGVICCLGAVFDNASLRASLYLPDIVVDTFFP